MSEVVSLVSSVGFPIAVAAFCLTQLKNTIEANTKALTLMQGTLQRISDKLDVHP